MKFRMRKARLNLKDWQMGSNMLCPDVEQTQSGRGILISLVSFIARASVHNEVAHHVRAFYGEPPQRNNAQREM